MKFTRPQFDVSLFHPDCQTAAEDKKEIIRVGMAVPNELPVDLHHHNVVVIIAGDNAWAPMIGDFRQLVCQIYRLHVHVSKDVGKRQVAHSPNTHSSYGWKP